MSSWKKNSGIFLVFLLVSCFALLPFIYSKTGVLGTDAYFQYNRIYEAAMQIKEHNFSFLNLYTFQQAGRIVNQLYSPLIGYLLGGLLLLVGSWFKFQLLSFIVLFMVAGLSMYYAGQKLGFSTRLSVFLGMLYLSSHAIYPFITTGTFRSFGFAIVPLFIIPMVNLYKGNWSLKNMVGLGVLIGALAQIQLISVLFMLPVLIYPTLRGIIKSTDKLKHVGYLVVGAMTSIVLSLNVLVPFIELSRNNHLLRPTKMKLMDGVLNIMDPTNKLVPDQIITLCVVVGLVGLVVFWTKIQSTTKVILISGLGYVIVGSGVTPWHLIDAQMPALGSLLQMPMRIGYLGFAMIILGVVAMLVDVLKEPRNTEWIEVIAGCMAVLSMFVMMFSIFQPQINTYRSPDKTIKEALHIKSPNLLFPKSYNKIQAPRTAKDVERLLHSDELSEFIMTVDRTTPDYLPTRKQESHVNKFYRIYKERIIFVIDKFAHKIDDNGKVKLSWEGKGNTEKEIPLFAYHRSEVTVNGHVVPANDLKTTDLGNLIIKEQLGQNEVSVEYKISMVSLVSIWVSISGWLFLLGAMVFKAFKRK